MIEVSDKNTKLFVIFCLTAANTLFHQGTPRGLMYLHIMLQALFLIPVSLAGLWFGRKGGLAAAAAIAAVYTHHVVTVMMPTTEMAVSNSIQILLLFIVGFLIGTYAETREDYMEIIQERRTHPASFPPEQRLLVYLDESGASTSAVRYVANLFGKVPNVKVTLMIAGRVSSPELFQKDEDRKEAHASTIEYSRQIVQRAQDLLVQSGFAADSIETRVLERRKARTSDIILEEQKSGDYTAIVLGHQRVSRAEEFLFGSPAVRLVRQASCPVWIIGAEASSQPASRVANEAMEGPPRASALSD